MYCLWGYPASLLESRMTLITRFYWMDRHNCLSIIHRAVIYYGMPSLGTPYKSPTHSGKCFALQTALFSTRNLQRRHPDFTLCYKSANHSIWLFHLLLNLTQYWRTRLWRKGINAVGLYPCECYQFIYFNYIFCKEKCVVWHADFTPSANHSLIGW